MGNFLSFLCCKQNVSLPQNDEDIQGRKRHLNKARNKYQLEQKTFRLTEDQKNQVNLVNVPPMLRSLPREEKRSCISEIRFIVEFLFYQIYSYLFGNGRWTIRRMINLFTSSWVLREPKGCEVWRTELVDDDQQTPLQRAQADHWFAWQRLNGVTRNLIKRVHEVPEQFVHALDEIQENHPYLDGQPLTKLAKNGTLYAVDLTEVAIGEHTIVAPMALFIVNNNMLMPVAIRINARLTNGKVFKPSTGGTAEDVRGWVKARMWFNMVDAQYHETITHLGFTHLLMDGVSVCMHRYLSYRHPIYKLLLPHFQYMHVINTNAQKDLIEPGGFVDEDMYFGRIHMLKHISSNNANWTYSANGSLKASLIMREADEIPGYFFKDDALDIHEAIRKFVTEYATHYYSDDDQNVREDDEIQTFRQELMSPRSMDQGGGCGMKGIPEFDSIKNLVDVLTNFIYICSVEHSATNFPQYDQYVFPPNYAATLHGHHESTDTLDAAMPDGKEIFSAIQVMKILTLVLTNSLGNYKWSYLKQMDAEGRTFVQNFQENLAEIKNTIIKRNKAIEEHDNEELVKDYPYEWLLQDKVLNSISS